MKFMEKIPGDVWRGIICGYLLHDIIGTTTTVIAFELGPVSTATAITLIAIAFAIFVLVQLLRRTDYAAIMAIIYVFFSIAMTVIGFYTARNQVAHILLINTLSDLSFKCIVLLAAVHLALTSGATEQRTATESGQQ